MFKFLPKLTLVFALMLSVNFMYAQVSGSITDESGEPLIGVNIIEKGTSNGTITDFDGNYSLNVSSYPATLEFSYTGYSEVELVVNG